jgi:serine-type D-Ala-D-Ala endopeptidase (penicillin-binding protein 7)
MLRLLVRRVSALLLAGVVACTAMTADAATARAHRRAATPTRTAKASATRSKTHVSKRTAKSSRKKSTAAARRSRRARRAPPAGGVYARNAVVIDPRTGEVLYEKAAGTSVPIASLTKLMTALVFLERKPDLDREVVVTRAEIDGAGRTRLHNLERVRLGDLLHMSLMCSDNCATRVLARESGLEPEDFMARMNRKAVELGLTHTRFVEVTGLDERNVSTATDVARLMRATASQPLFGEITTTRSYEFRSDRWDHAVHNTNRLLYSRYEILGGKTGFINEAGYCFATWVRDQGRDLIAVVLGAPTNATRFADVVRLLNKVSPPEADVGR